MRFCAAPSSAISVACRSRSIAKLLAHADQIRQARSTGSRSRPASPAARRRASSRCGSIRVQSWAPANTAGGGWWPMRCSAASTSAISGATARQRLAHVGFAAFQFVHASFHRRHPLFVGANAGGAFDQRRRELAPVLGKHLVFSGELLLGLGRLLLLGAQRIELLLALLDDLGGGLAAAGWAVTGWAGAGWAGTDCFAALSALDCGDSTFCACLARSAGAGRFSGLPCTETIPTAHDEARRHGDAAPGNRRNRGRQRHRRQTIFVQFQVSSIPRFANCGLTDITAQLSTNSDQLGQDHAAEQARNRAHDDKAKLRVDPAPPPCIPRSLAVVRMSGQDRKGPINLLQQHDSHELMGPGRSARRRGSDRRARADTSPRPSAPPMAKKTLARPASFQARRRPANDSLETAVAAAVEGDGHGAVRDHAARARSIPRECGVRARGRGCP